MAWVCASTPLAAQSVPPEVGATHTAIIHEVTVNHKQAMALVIHRTAAEYPPVAKMNYIQGAVLLEVTVNAEGRVVAEHVREGNALLADSAMKAVSQWKYRPLEGLHGPTGYITTARLAFTLLSKKMNPSPKEAEREFLRGLKPAVRIHPAVVAQPSEVVHVRALVSDQGQVIDVAPNAAGETLESARASMRGWVYRPAHWGSLPVASYVEEDVPLNPPALTRAKVDPGH